MEGHVIWARPATFDMSCLPHDSHNLVHFWSGVPSNAKVNMLIEQGLLAALVPWQISNKLQKIGMVMGEARKRKRWMALLGLIKDKIQVLQSPQNSKSHLIGAIWMLQR